MCWTCSVRERDYGWTSAAARAFTSTSWRPRRSWPTACSARPVITAVWGAAYLAEAAARVVIVQNTPAGTALATSKVLPYAVAGVLAAWTVGYGRYQKRRRERLAAAATAPASAHDVHPGNQPAPETLPAERPRPERP